jgi:hypothetical protein
MLFHSLPNFINGRLNAPMRSLVDGRFRCSDGQSDTCRIVRIFKSKELVQDEFRLLREACKRSNFIRLSSSFETVTCSARKEAFDFKCSILEPTTSLLPKDLSWHGPKTGSNSLE